MEGAWQPYVVADAGAGVERLRFRYGTAGQAAATIRSQSATSASAASVEG